MNRYSILRFGSTFEFVEMRLRKEGYQCEWSCMNSPGCDGGKQQWPKDFDWQGHESGWEMRRKIKAWCVAHDIRDYRIVRNTKYCRDLHGVVYELWIHRKDVIRRALAQRAAEGKALDKEGYHALCSSLFRDNEDYVVAALDDMGFRKEGNKWLPPAKGSK